MTEVLYFSAPWCGPCQQLGPIVEQVAQKHPNIKVTKLDIESEEGVRLGMKYGVRSIPHLIAPNLPVHDLIGGSNEKSVDLWFEMVEQGPKLLEGLQNGDIQ